MKKPILVFLLLTKILIAQDLQEYRVHSHNDYLQNAPFWKAFAAGATSLEADIFLVKDSLYVAHTAHEIDSKRTFENLYLQPLQQAILRGTDLPDKLQLLIDIKSDPYNTLDAIVEVLEKYPLLLDQQAISYVISGNRPKPFEYVNYPEFIQFDYQSLEPVDSALVLKKIALVSLSFKKVSLWNGKGRLTPEDLDKVETVIKSAHSLGKPFRFWASPDSKSAWKALFHLGVDYINTDKPFECARYLKTLKDREYKNLIFSEVYEPTFESDATAAAAENLILMIGDGNGLAQISATALANAGELSLTQLKSIGLIKTQSSDDFTTDSAGAGSAIATGQKVPNRAIGVDATGKSVKNITEVLAEKGFVTGIVTTDEITGATPSSFYAHQKDRSMHDGIQRDLLKSTLSLLVSANSISAEQQNRFGDYELVGSLEEMAVSSKEKLGFLFPKNNLDDNTTDPLAKAVFNALAFLDRKKKPFFLMVEGAKIDSYGHANDITGVVKEGIAFDQAISEALKFADANKNTLVIVTADHETGGLSIPQGNTALNEIEGDFTTDDHTGVFVPIFAYGPRSSNFQGVYENNEVFHKMLHALNRSDHKN